MHQTDESLRGWIIDVDGCLVQAAKYGGDEGEPISGAVEFLKFLEEQGEPYVVCTNASGNRPSSYARNLRSMGLPVSDSHFETAGSMSADYVARKHPNTRVAALGTDEFLATLHQRGITTVSGEESEEADVVIIGDGHSVQTSDINHAALAVDAGAAFYCTVGQRWFMGGVGKAITSSALIAAGIAWTTGKSPEITGKPSAALGTSLAGRLGVAPEQIIVVGDALAEVELARNIGGTSFLVLTGGVDRETAEGLQNGSRPDAIFDSINDVYRMLQHHADT